MKRSRLRVFLCIMFIIFCSTSMQNVSFLLASETGGAKGTRVTVQEGSYYTCITPEELAGMLKQKDFLFVNVHIPYEGEIEKTDLFIPYNEIEKNIDRLPENMNSKIVVYCKTDRMSVIAAHTLVKLGYKNIWSLEGGMDSWEKAGYHLINKE